MTAIILVLLIILSCHTAIGFQASAVLGTTKRLHQLKSAILDEPATSTNLPPLLQDMVEERREFELNLGKAMDTLRKDYPDMLHKSPGKHCRPLLTSPRHVAYLAYYVMLYSTYLPVS